MRATMTDSNPLGESITVGDTAAMLKVPLTLAHEYLLMAERKGALCRDDGPQGLRFYYNFFKEDLSSWVFERPFERPF